MKKKHIRTIIICALVLMAAITTILNIDIEPANEPPETSVVSTPVSETEKEQEKEVVSEKTDEENRTSIEINKPDENVTPIAADKHFCTIEIRCDTVTDTSKLENQAVAPYVPKSGVILKKYEIEFTPGESVFDVLLRTTREMNIQMEFRDDSSYSGKYIEGINYLYEMDGGPLSGWMYKVNGKFPNYGCAAYEVKDGDAIVWMYTCDLGVDVGDNSTW